MMLYKSEMKNCVFFLSENLLCLGDSCASEFETFRFGEGSGRILRLCVYIYLVHFETMAIVRFYFQFKNPDFSIFDAIF